MREQGEGFIINISSVAGFMGFPIVPAYVCSKFALEGFTECLRHELYEKNSDKQIHAVLIEPGVVNTSFYDNMKVAKDARNVPKHKEMLDGMSIVGLNGFDCEMASGAVPAGIKKLLNQNIMKKDDRIIGILTGRQKEPLLPINYHNEPKNQFARPPKR